jgi:hypothetical protein
VSIPVTTRRERVKAEAAALEGGVAKAERAARQFSVFAAAVIDGKIPPECAVEVAAGLSAVVNAGARHLTMSMAAAARQAIEAIEARSPTAHEGIGRALRSALSSEAFLASATNDIDTCSTAVARLRALTDRGRLGAAGFGPLSYGLRVLVWARTSKPTQSASDLLDQLEALAEAGATNNQNVLLNWLEAESYSKPDEIARRGVPVDAVAGRFAGERWIELLRLRLRSKEMNKLPGDNPGRIMAAFGDLRTLAVAQFGVDEEFVMFLLQGLGTVASAYVTANQLTEFRRTTGELERWPMGTPILEALRSLQIGALFSYLAERYLERHDNTLAIEEARRALDEVAKCKNYASRINVVDFIGHQQKLVMLEIKLFSILTLGSALNKSIADYRRFRETLHMMLVQFESIADWDGWRPEAQARLQQADDYIQSLQNSAALNS